MLTRCLGVALSSTFVLAQSVSPSHFGPAEGPNNNVVPFGNTTVPFRYAQIHDDVPVMLIQGMAFRHNWSATTYAAHSVTIDMWMSTAVTASNAMSGTFDNNHGPDKTQVISNRTYTHPASDPSDLPGEFVLDYPFDVPFLFLGPPSSLCWEVHVTAKTQTGSIVYDAAAGGSTTTSSPASPAAVLGRFGVGCAATGLTNPMAATATQTTNWLVPTMTLTVSGTNLLPNSAHVFTMGADKTQFGGIPLPAVIPGSACNVYSDAILLSAVVSSAAGTASNPLTFLPQPSYHGVTIYSQIWAVDPPANPLGLSTSNAAMHHLVAPYTVPLPASRVFLSASLGPVGTLASGYSLVTRFY